MLSDGDRVVIAVSGGPDSVAMLDLLCRLNLRLDLHVAHLDHLLRSESDVDANFVARLAEERELPFHCHTEDVAARAKREKRSIEDAARQARREFHVSVYTRIQAKRIGLGHTRSDQAETVLLRLLQGAGLTGLGGIRPVSKGTWIRPLLETTRTDIEQYVRHRNLAVRHDQTNADQHYVRNRIRAHLIPEIADRYNPSIEPVLARTADLLQQDDDLLESLAQQAFADALRYCGKSKIILDVERFFGYHISLRRRLLRTALFALQAGRDAVGYRAVQRVLKTLAQCVDHCQISPDISAHRSGDTLILARPTPPYHIPVCIEGKTNLPAINASLHTVSVPKDGIDREMRQAAAGTTFFDLDQLPHPLHVRSIRAGDRIAPFGMRGRRTVADLLIDNQIPRTLRDEVPLLVSGDTLLWVAGIRRGQAAPVTEQTCRVLRIHFKGGWQHVYNHPEKRLL